jgi:malonyl-CoA O-methyltransferase
MMGSRHRRQFVDQRQVRRNFARAAATYDEVAVLQREVGSRMLERLDYVRIEPQRVLDLGCGTGASLVALHERYPQAALIGADLSEPMLRAGRAQRSRIALAAALPARQPAPLLAADAAALPFGRSRSACCGRT